MRDPLDNETGIRVDDIYPGVLEFDQDASLYADDAGLHRRAWARRRSRGFVYVTGTSG